MEIKNTDYPLFLNQPVGEIPREKLTDIITELSANAMFQMNSVIKGDLIKPTIESIVSTLREKFSSYPLHLVSLAIDQGSLGELGGTSLFSVRNVYVWLSTQKEKYEKLRAEQRSREENHRKAEEDRKWKENGRGDAIFGTALFIKLSWVYSCRINPDNWDLYTLDDIARLLHFGETPQTITPEMIRS